MPVEQKQKLHFNPRSREGSDSENGYEDEEQEISIHAPAKGATISVGRHDSVCYFNPRSREGSDDAGWTVRQCLI